MEDIKRQIWYCPKCRAIGCYVYNDSTDIFGIVDGIRMMHENSSSGCESDVKAIALENIKKNTILEYRVS